MEPEPAPRAPGAVPTPSGPVVPTAPVAAAAGAPLPPAIAPFEVVVSPVNVKDETIQKAALEIATRLESAGFDVILDDRDERPGVKFKDADLVGIPFRVTVGKKVTEGTVEIVLRSTREVRDATLSEVEKQLKELLRGSGPV